MGVESDRRAYYASQGYRWQECCHETYHTGQTELLRQLAGTDDKVV